MLILGVLDGIPHKCVFDADFLESILDKSVELETQIYRFLCATLQLEWLSTLISSGLLPMQRSQGQSLITGVYSRSFILLLLNCYPHVFYLSCNHYYPIHSLNISIIIIHTIIIVVYIQPVVTCSDVCLRFYDRPCLKCVDSQHRNGHPRYVQSPVSVYVCTCVCLCVCIYVRVSVLCLIHVFMILRVYPIKLN